MSFLTPNIPSPPPAPEPPAEPDLGRAAVMAEEAQRAAGKNRKGRGSTIVAGALGDTKEATGQTPTLMG